MKSNQVAASYLQELADLLGVAAVCVRDHVPPAGARRLGRCDVGGHHVAHVAVDGVPAGLALNPVLRRGFSEGTAGLKGGAGADNSWGHSDGRRCVQAIRPGSAETSDLRADQITVLIPGLASGFWPASNKW